MPSCELLSGKPRGCRSGNIEKAKVMHFVFDAIAGWCSILGFVIGIPSLLAIYLQVRATAKQRERSTVADMVKFTNVQDDVGINIADFAKMPFLPRIGEEITIPEPSPEVFPKYGHFRVVSIHYVCFADDGQDAELGNIHVGLEPILAGAPEAKRR
jgi:hypothetical protein